MGHKFAEITFTPAVRAVQLAQGSHDGYDFMFTGNDVNHVLGEREIQFIQARDSFYMASISETGWPYINHRGGPQGFMRVIDEKTIGFADFSGNRQYISTGNLMNNDRVALFFMDYPNRTRLKVLGHARFVDVNDTDIIKQLEDDNYRAHIERGILIDIEAFDWNCPQHITPRYSDAYISTVFNSASEQLMQDVPVYPSELGSGPLKLVVSGIRQLTPRVRAYELRNPEGRDLPEVQAGAHIPVPVQLDTGETVIRHYSICSNPARRDIYEIAVLITEGSEGGSHAIHAHYDLGLILHCDIPGNHFTMHKDKRPAVLIAGGIGITPIKAIAQALKARGTTVFIHYAGRHHHDMAFRDRLEREFSDNISFYSATNNKHLDIEQLLLSIEDNVVIYACGPEGLLDDVINTARKLNINPKRIHLERFTVSIPNNSKPIIVELRRSNMELYVNQNQTILDAMLKAGVTAPHSCRNGTCKTCAVHVLAGEADHRDTVLNEDERQQLICPCVSRARSEYLVLDI